MADVAVIGGGIVGCAAAAYLAEAGASVVLHERGEVASAASGRNSGVLQDPFDPALRPLFDASIGAYDELDGFDLPPVAGVLMLAEDPAELAGERDALREDRLQATWLDEEALRGVEPGLGDGLVALRLETGRPVPPAAATRAFAERARRAGAEIRERSPAMAADAGARADAVLVCAGPWTPAVCGVPLPIAPVWGVVAQVTLADPPRHVVEEAGVERIAAEPEAVPSVFSLVTAGGASALGSTFLPDAPDPAAVGPRLRERGARFVPALARAPIAAVRACARPQSADGRPFLGPVGGVWIAAGHGPWGISLGPGSARLVVDALLGDDRIPDVLRADRVLDA
jgi:sarcosine oxidase subunit beta